MALLEEDRRWLERNTGRSAISLEKWCAAGLVCLVLCGLVNLIIACWLSGQPIPAILQLWASGIRFDATYSGLTVKVLDRVTTAVLQVGVAIGGGLHLIAQRRLRARYQRILAACYSSAREVEGTECTHR